jgi:DNA repair protein RadD
MANIVLRQYQKYAVNSIFEYFKAGNKGNPLVLLPQGTGKSVVIADFVREAITQWPGTRIMMLTHVKELIEQNYAKLLSIWPTAPAGIFSAGLGAKDAFYPITFGGVSSVAKCKTPSIFGKIDLLIIDECHLVSPNDATEYNRIIKQLKKVNPFLKVIGFTATDFRLGHGKLTENDHLFTDVAVNMTTLDGFNWFFDEGYLVRLVPKRTKLTVDSSKIKMRQGEFVE